MKKIWTSVANRFQNIGVKVFLVILCSSDCLESKDFGIQGELFVLEEESLMKVLRRKIAQLSSANNMNSLLESLQDKAQPLKSPLVPSEALSRKVYYYDPTYVLKEPITDKEGQTLFAKGTKVNPLQHTKLTTGLLFFDGSSTSHLAWARSQRGSFKWILVQGNPLQLEEKENRPIYFDQQGFSISKFQIEHIPARITQEDLLLKIEEIPADEMEEAS